MAEVASHAAEPAVIRGGSVMRLRLLARIVFVLVVMPVTVAWADDYDDNIQIFKDAGESGGFFDNSHGYAIFPNIGKGGLGIGGAYGKGRVYVGGKHVGDTSMSQLTIGLQLGGQAYSQIIFFQDKRAFDEFSSGNFEFGATASAVAITAGASASASTGGRMAVFTIAKGGLMYEASIGGQKFSYTAK
jgi:lipid-binding SYLF domain-containing protein